MKAALVVTLAVAPAAATTCSAGYKHKADLTNQFCAGSGTGAAGCNAGCCEEDKSTCGGLAAAGSNKCEFGTYFDNSDAWKNTKTTANKKGQKQFQKDCCKPVSTCASTVYTCPAGKRKTQGANSAVHCPSNGASCATSPSCCVADDKTCGGTFDTEMAKGANAFKTYTPGGIPCAPGAFPVSKTAGSLDAVVSDDSWRKIADTATMTVVTFRAKCCFPKATCSDAGYKCPVGYKKNTDKAAEAVTCGSGKDWSASTCAESKGVGKNSKKCCIKDDTTCGGQTTAITCASAAQYYPGSDNDNWKSKKITSTSKAGTECCTEKATCAVVSCKAGYVKKANVDTLSCPGGRASCADANARCCEVNKLTCAGLKASIQCPFGTYNEATYFTSSTPQATQDAWNNKATTAATKNTDCCTAKAACVNTETTTPAPTVTPAAPVAARLYSAHKAAAGSSSGSSVLWVGAGAFIGMAVLAGVQKFRGNARSETREIEIE